MNPEQHETPVLRVHHDWFGSGSVVESINSGLRLRVQFDNGLAFVVRREELSVLVPENTDATSDLERHVPSPDADGTSEASQSTDGLRATHAQSPKGTSRDIVEAMRLGIVRDDVVSDLTFGREKEIETFSRWLGGASGSLYLSGEYGSGKTHLLAYFREVALQAGYAVAHIALHTQDTTFWRPKHLYRGITESFQYVDTAGERHGYVQYLSDLSQSATELISHRYLGAILRSIRESRLQDYLIDWIMGREVRVRPQLPDQSTAWNIYSHILSAISSSTVEDMGLKGMVMLIDEAESIETAYPTAIQRRAGRSNLEALLRACDNDQILVDEPVSWFHYGERSGLRYNGRSHAPFVFRTPSHLQCVVAFADADVAEMYSEDDVETKFMSIGPLEENALLRVIDHIRLVYGDSFNFESPPEVESLLMEFVKVGSGASQPRMLVKTAVEALDLLRHQSVDSPSELLPT